MRNLRCAVLVVAVLAAILLNSGPASAAEDGPYLFEQLKHSTYLASFKAIFQGQTHLEPWLKEYIRTRNGVDMPGTTQVINDQTYSVHEVCQPHNCPGNVLYVLFTPAGGRAYALFTKDDGSHRFFGNPDTTLQEALLQRARQ